MAAKKKAPASKAPAGQKEDDRLAKREEQLRVARYRTEYKGASKMNSALEKRAWTRYGKAWEASQGSRYIARSGDASGSRGTGRSLWSRIGGGLNLRGK